MPTLLLIEIWVLLLGLAIIVSYRMLTRAINMNGLLHDKGGSGGFSPMRLQLIVSTLAFGIYYVGLVLTMKEPGSLPRVPQEMLLLLGGSHLFYLGSKTFALLLETLGVSKPGNKASRNKASKGDEPK